MFYYMNPFLYIVAIIPGAYLLWYVYKQDRIEPEPRPLLVKLFILGIVSTSLAAFTEGIGSVVLGVLFGGDESGVIFRFLMYFIVVALSEEGFKYLLLKRGSWNHPAFDYQFDGIVYAVFVSLGFAIKENIMYVTSYGLATGIVRAFTAVPGHASFGIMMGAWYGMAKKYEFLDPQKSKTYLKRALWIPVFLHGLYDFAASSESEMSVIAFFVIVIIMFILCYNIVKVISRNDAPINSDPDFQYRDIQ